MACHFIIMRGASLGLCKCKKIRGSSLLKFLTSEEKNSRWIFPPTRSLTVNPLSLPIDLTFIIGGRGRLEIVKISESFCRPPSLELKRLGAKELQR